MGDIGRDTAVEELGDGRYRATLSRDWEIWGPNGGYIASVALRAMGRFTELPRPATFSCLFLGVAGWDDPVEIEVTSIRRAKRAEAVRACITQGDRAVLEAHMWVVDEGMSGLEHDVTEAPDVPGPDELKSIAELVTDGERPGSFWRNFEQKPLSWIPPEEWPPPPPVEPRMQQWFKFVPPPDLSDPWIDACRTLVMLDTWQWPASSRAHIHRGPEEQPYIAPSLNLAASFHRAAPESEWLFVDAFGPVAEAGLMGGEARLWSEDRRLIGTATSQMLCRPVPRGTPGSGTA